MGRRLRRRLLDVNAFSLDFGAGGKEREGGGGGVRIPNQRGLPKMTLRGFSSLLFRAKRPKYISCKGKSVFRKGNQFTCVLCDIDRRSILALPSRRSSKLYRTLLVLEPEAGKAEMRHVGRGQSLFPSMH